MTRTNACTLLCVGIRVVAIWLLAEVVMLLPTLVMMNVQQTPPTDVAAWPFAIPVVAGVVIAAGLWVFAARLARLAVSGSTDLVFESDLDASTWLGIGLSLIGAWCVLGAVVEGVTLLVRAIVLARMRHDYPGMATPPGFAEDVGRAVVRLLLGAGLLLRGRGLSALLYRLRYAGYRGEVSDD